jgi:hypothetical protein
MGLLIAAGSPSGKTGHFGEEAVRRIGRVHVLFWDAH